MNQQFNECIGFADSFIPQYATSLWHIERELWIAGPKLPEMIALYPSFVCAVTLNSTTVMFISEESQPLITYNFQNNVWKYKSDVVVPWKLQPSSCSLVQDKQTRM